MTGEYHMDIKQIKKNIEDIGDYASKFPNHAGMRWVREACEQTLTLFGNDKPKKKKKEEPAKKVKASGEEASGTVPVLEADTEMPEDIIIYHEDKSSNGSTNTSSG